jgi:hypothetical protein
MNCRSDTARSVTFIFRYPNVIYVLIYFLLIIINQVAYFLTTQHFWEIFIEPENSMYYFSERTIFKYYCAYFVRNTQGLSFACCEQKKLGLLPRHLSVSEFVKYCNFLPFNDVISAGSFILTDFNVSYISWCSSPLFESVSSTGWSLNLTVSFEPRLRIYSRVGDRPIPLWNVGLFTSITNLSTAFLSYSPHSLSTRHIISWWMHFTALCY